MLYDGIIISILIGLLRKGSFKHFTSITTKWGLLFPLILVFDIILYYSISRFDLNHYLFILVYAVAILLIGFQRKLNPGFQLILVGLSLNLIVMVANGGRMPILGQAANYFDPSYIQALKVGINGHILLNHSTHLSFLGDIILLSNPYPREEIISIGDVVMNIGIFIFFQSLMVKSKEAEISDTYIIKGDLMKKV